MSTNKLSGEWRSVIHTFRFLAGNGQAIRELAADPRALTTMILLVLTAAIARNYDQRFIGANPFLWIFGSLLFSGFAALFHFSVIHSFFLKRILRPDHPEYRGWKFMPLFLVLFWATAPLAWLYAVPVERMTDLTTAAKWNVAFLAVVAIWRVALMARVFSVLIGVRFLKALGWVLIPASGEAFFVSIAGMNIGKQIMASMAGIVNAPEETVVMNLLGSIFIGAPVCLIIGFALAMLRDRKDLSKLTVPPDRSNSWIPRFWPLLILTLFAIVAIKSQQKLAHNHHIEQLFANEEYRAAIDYLSAHTIEDFAPAKRLPPALHESSIFEELPNTLDQLDGSEAKWVGELYLSYFETMLTFHFHHFGPDFEYGMILTYLERAPLPSGWISKNSDQLAELFRIASYRVEPEVFDQIRPQLERLQIPLPEQL